MIGLGRVYKDSDSSTTGVRSPGVDDNDVVEGKKSDGENGEP